MGEKTQAGLKKAFQGEAEAHFRNLAFAGQAEKDGYPQIAHMFRAIAEAEAVHCRNALRLRGIVKDTESNLQAAFEHELAAKNEHYPQLIKVAEEEGERPAALIFSRTKDVEELHASIYKKALDHLMEERETEYYVCSVCGWIADSQIPDECPICQAPPEKFDEVK
ncbi:MAG: rubrerythrin family protein [Candidatus Lernaella stagnicola]|nr:rubrerythrin family protein [Candidatus Lernaella stagnicola]